MKLLEVCFEFVLVDSSQFCFSEVSALKSGRQISGTLLNYISDLYLIIVN